MVLRGGREQDLEVGVVSNQVEFIYIAHFSQKEIRRGGREGERGDEDKWRSAEQKERLGMEGLRER